MGCQPTRQVECPQSVATSAARPGDRVRIHWSDNWGVDDAIATVVSQQVSCCAALDQSITVGLVLGRA